MRMARTSRLSLTKYQTMTFIRKGSDYYRLVYNLELFPVHSMDHRIGDNQAKIGDNLIEAVHLASPIPLWTITNSAAKQQKKPQAAVRTRN